ncbi:Cyclic nucleotide-binding protein [Georgfuchsia toluolica]|uniref:Cyclic nucleotide-binding protein n=1 Tax=Georgfuchsia toluolica TaxID=424218 RepID=A0A916J281_9PROT|nr:SIMPL domain-containing protein [Georgfuchsia toluolica]CAG4882644.1 Cyclic nucleotide-binding protein [Georgfuchsia toluolica]
MHSLPKSLAVSMLSLCVFCSTTLAADEKKPVGTLLSFSVEASQMVANDLAHAIVFAEATDTQSAEVARKVNAAMARAIAVAKTYPDIKTKTGATWTAPVYGKNGRNIESWHMRSEIHLESQKLAALAELVGKLQEDLAVSQITLQPATETRRNAEDMATLDALNAFQAKAQLIASNFKKLYRIINMNVSGGSHGPAYPMARGAMLKMEAAPMPIEGGDGVVTVSVNGEIELID